MSRRAKNRVELIQHLERGGLVRLYNVSGYSKLDHGTPVATSGYAFSSYPLCCSEKEMWGNWLQDPTLWVLVSEREIEALIAHRDEYLRRVYGHE